MNIVLSIHYMDLLLPLKSQQQIDGHQILPQQLNQLHELFQQYAKEITLDAGYYNAQCANELFKRGFFVSIPYKRSQTKEHPSCRRHQFKKLNETTYACQWAYRFVIQHQRAKAITNLKHQKEAAKLPVRFKRKRPYFKAFYSSKNL